MNKKIKELLFNHCKKQIESRLFKYNTRDKELYESLNSETKSSAGDKHETGRGMLQLEREKIGNQIKRIEKEYELLAKIKINFSSSTIILGSVIETKKNQYYMSFSAEPLIFNTNKYYCISSKSPIGLLLYGKKKGDFFDFNQNKIKILDVY
tara:strand:+ start:739 stop:1194 length:456 start_codon:yes stop_codon:yes gene_type:complete